MPQSPPPPPSDTRRTGTVASDAEQDDRPNNRASTGQNVPDYHAIVLGEPASKANSRKIVLHGRTPRVIKSDKARAYCSAFVRQVKSLPKLLAGDLSITLRIFYSSRRPDLDESLILDLLQGVAYENDRQIKEKHIIWGLDPANPRCEIAIYALADGNLPGAGGSGPRRPRRPNPGRALADER